MVTHSQEKPSSRISSTGPYSFRLFGKQGPFSMLSKIRWMTSKKRRTTGKQPLLSMLNCCTFNDNQDQPTNRQQVRSQPTTQKPQSNNPTPSQTVTYSTTSLSLTEMNIDDNTANTDKRPCDIIIKEKAIHHDHEKPTCLTENMEEPSSNDNNINILPNQTTADSHQNSEMMVQNGIISHMDENDDLQERTTPSLDIKQDLWLLEPIIEKNKGRKCLVLDLDETLVHSSFKATAHADFVVPVEIDGSYHNVYVLKRPGVDTFMKRMGELFEIVVFTASLSKYADPVLDNFDIHDVVQHRLFRESCFHHKGTYVKDLSQLGRQLNQIIILDNSPASYIFHTTSAIPVSTWFNDPHDSELVDLIPFLEELATVDDVTDVLDSTLPHF